jgi:hypothetical protein
MGEEQKALHSQRSGCMQETFFGVIGVLAFGGGGARPAFAPGAGLEQAPAPYDARFIPPRVLGVTQSSAALFAAGHDARGLAGEFFGHDVHHALLPVVKSMEPERFPQAAPAAHP